MKKALLVTDIFPPDIGGPATFIPALAKALGARGHDVTVVCLSDVAHASGDDETPARIRRIRRDGNRAVQEVETYAVLLREAWRADVIFCNGLERYVAAACRALGKRYWLKVVGDVAWENARFRGQTLLGIDAYQTTPRRRDFVRRAHRIVTPSHYLRDMVAGWGYPRSQVHVIPNGIARDGFDGTPARRRKGSPMRILYAGRLADWKGVDSLLLAARELPDAELTIAGDGPASPLLGDLARRMGSRARFTGRLDAKGLAREMARHHVLVLPSLYEGLSHTLLEAGARALPCIASNVGGNPELIEDGVNGALCDPFDVPALVAKIRAFADDEPYRRRSALALQRTVREKFSLEQAVVQYEQLLFPESS